MTTTSYVDGTAPCRPAGTLYDVLGSFSTGAW